MTACSICRYEFDDDRPRFRWCPRCARFTLVKDASTCERLCMDYCYPTL